MEEKSLFKSQEIKSNCGAFYPYNSYSSLFYLLVIIKLFNNKTDFTNTYGIMLFTSLTISSLFWWAFKNKFFHLIDIISYTMVIFYIGIYFLNKYTKFKYIIFYTILLTIITTYISITQKKNIKLLNYFGIITSIIIVCKNITKIDHLVGLTLLIISIFLKICDTYNIIDFNKNNLKSGTFLFHILSAIGLYILF